MANLVRKFKLTHLATKVVIELPLLISTYEQNAKPNFSSTTVYGRMDPIFTYQNTVRSFSVTCKTLLQPEWKSYHKNAENIKKGANKSWATMKEDQVRQKYGGFISDIYKMMYPLYEKEVSGTGPDLLITNTLKSPPILELSIDNIIGQSSPVIFVPESFSLVQGLADSNKINITVDSTNDLQYIVTAGGYGFTLGGTILHTDNPPGFVQEQGTPGKYKFSPNKNFPFEAGTSIDILKEEKKQQN